MKKLFHIATLCILAACCSRISPAEKSGMIALSGLNFDISVEGAGQTRSVKTAWEPGDKINIWFDDHCSQATPDLIISYDGLCWNRTFEREGCMLSANGTFAALFESGNNLGAFSISTTASSATYIIPAADIDGFRFCSTPMVTSTEGVSYSVNTSTSVLKARITGWQFATRFKVFIPDDPSMDKGADGYAMSVSKVCHPLKSFGAKKEPGDDGVSISTTSDIMNRYSGGVQENGGIAFYFDGMSCSDEQITFALLEVGSGISRTYTTSEKKTLNATSGSSCTSVQIRYSSFSGDAFTSGDGEEPINNGDSFSNFQIVYQLTDLEDSVTLGLSQKLASRIGAAKGVTPTIVESGSTTAKGDEIIIGRTTRPQSEEYYSKKLDDFKWKVNYTEGNVVITAGGSWALEYAVDRFAEEFLDPDFIYKEGRVMEGTVRGMQLFPITEGCNLRILDQNVWAREDDSNTGYWEDRGESCALSVRVRRLAQVVRSCMPDIITFQEFGNGLNTAMKDSLKKYGYVTNLRANNDYTPIFYNSETVEYAGKMWHQQFQNYTASNGSVKAPDSMKSYTAALFRLKTTGREFLVVSTHMFTAIDNKYDYECKTSEATLIRDAVDGILKTYDVPVFLAGDMNCNRSSDAMKLLEESGYRHVVDIATVSADGSNGWHPCTAEKFIREYDPSMVGHRMGWTHDRNDGATRCYDHIYLYNGSDVEVKVFERMHAWFTVLLSDHYPNYADIVL